MAGLGAVTVAAVAGGAFLITRDGGDSTADDTVETPQVELSTDPNATDTSGAFSFAGAAANAEQAVAARFEMSVESPDGPMSITADFDRSSQRIAMDIDVSHLVDESGFDFGDDMQMVVDESAGRSYVRGGFFAFFGMNDQWIEFDAEELSADEDMAIDDLFSDPLSMTRVFGDAVPTDLGIETIEGEELHHYRVAITPEMAATADEDVFDFAFNGNHKHVS